MGAGQQDIEAAVKKTARMLRRPGAEIELTVWCTVPSDVAWQRAIRQAGQVRQETIKLLKLRSEQQAKLTAVARSWPWDEMHHDTEKYPDKDTIVKRPAMSISVRVTKPPAE